MTGASGFVGSGLLARLISEGGGLGRYTILLGERKDSGPGPAVERRVDLGAATDSELRSALAGVDAVVHLAARAHVMRETSTDPLSEYRRANVDLTRRLARLAAQAGARRFVLMSTVKVHGERGSFTERDPIAPEDPYSVSKAEAEVALREIAAGSEMQAVIIRAPLVYGPGVRGNFSTLIRAIEWRIPLPLGAIRNSRSLVALDNLVDFIILCITHPAAAGETFLVSDGEDLSTPGLVRRLARAMGRGVLLIPMPVPALRAGAALFGRARTIDRLVESLRVDTSRARSILGWSPRVSVDAGLQRVASALVS